jgi:hypothetical protein
VNWLHFATLSEGAQPVGPSVDGGGPAPIAEYLLCGEQKPTGSRASGISKYGRPTTVTGAFTGPLSGAVAPSVLRGRASGNDLQIARTSPLCVTSAIALTLCPAVAGVGVGEDVPRGGHHDAVAGPEVAPPVEDLVEARSFSDPWA